MTRRSNRKGGGARAPAADGEAEVGGLPPFPVVGIGASAGGLEAVTHLGDVVPEFVTPNGGVRPADGDGAAKPRDAANGGLRSMGDDWQPGEW